MRLARAVGFGDIPSVAVSFRRHPAALIVVCEGYVYDTLVSAIYHLPVYCDL